MVLQSVFFLVSGRLAVVVPNLSNVYLEDTHRLQRITHARDTNDGRFSGHQCLTLMKKATRAAPSHARTLPRPASVPTLGIGRRSKPRAPFIRTEFGLQKTRSCSQLSRCAERYSMLFCVCSGFESSRPHRIVLPGTENGCTVWPLRLT